MRVCFKPISNDPTHASSRIRCLPVANWLSQHGITLVSDQNAEVTVSFKRLQPGGQFRILDIADNHFWPEENPLAEQLRRDTAAADLVVCGTPELACWAEKYSGNVTVIPDTIDPLAKPVTNWGQDKKLWNPKFMLWYGVWGSKYQFPSAMRAALEIEDLLGDHGYRLAICSNNRQLFEELGFQHALYFEWSIGNQRFLMSRTAGVVVPSVSTPFTRAKSHNRVTTAIAAGVPVHADPLPQYDGFGCTGPWEDFLANPQPIDRKVLEPYNINVIGGMWRCLLTGEDGI